MVITASVLLIGLLLLIRPLQKNSFYLLHCGIVILAAYYIETHYFRVTPFAPKTLLLFLVYQFISINLENSRAQSACPGNARRLERRTGRAENSAP